MSKRTSTDYISILEQALAADYANPQWTEERRRCIEAVIETGSKAAAGRALGLHVETIRKHCMTTLLAASNKAKPAITKETSMPKKRGTPINFSRIRIEKNVPITLRGSGLRGSLRDFLRRLDVGDSFLLKGIGDKNWAYRGVHTTAKSMGIKVTIRRINDGIRVWRSA